MVKMMQFKVEPVLQYQPNTTALSKPTKIKQTTLKLA